MSGLPTPKQRADGRWHAQLSLGYEGGKRRRKSVYGATKAECKNNLIRALKDQQDGIAPMDQRITVGAFLPRWLEGIAPSLRPHTQRFYGDQVRLHLIPALGSVPLAKLTPEAVQRFVNAKAASGLSPRMVRHLRSTLRAALNQAVEWQLIQRNPAAARIRLPQLDDRGVNAMTVEQVLAMLSVSEREANRLHALWTVAVYLGLRQSEVLGLRWSNVDWTNVSLRVDKQIQRVDGGLQLVAPKTAYSVRRLVMPGPVSVALAAHQERQMQERMMQGYVDHGLIFATTIGTPIDPRNLIREWHGLTKRAGLPRFRFHDLRHTAATLMLAGGTSPILVAEVLGHRDATMILRTYGHVLPNTRAEAAQKMEAILG